jgi:DNA-binding helix-hairpin-helix protein with protein kinase domain
MAPPLFLPSGRRIEYGLPPIGEGDEAIIVPVTGHDSICLKIYRAPDPETEGRLLAMLQLPPRNWGGDRSDHLHLTWPMERVLDGQGATVGCVLARMPRDTNAQLANLFHPPTRVELLEAPTWLQMLVIARRIARVVDMLHQADVVIGDLSERNIMVSRSALVTVIDCDSMKVVDPRTGRTYSATRTTLDCSAPEILESRGGQTAVSEMSDRFSLAILLCQVMMEGAHPFEGLPRVGDGDGSAVHNIPLQNNWITHPEGFQPYRERIPVEVLPPAVLDLARRCFDEGHRNPELRPSAAEWHTALSRAEGSVVGCQANPRHLYHQELATCIWCGLRKAGLGERYPATVPAPARPPSRPLAPVPRLPARPGVPAPAPADGEPEVDWSKWSTWPAVAKAVVIILIILIIIIGFF